MPWGIFFFVLLALSGCVAPPAKLETTFNSDEAKFINAPGKGSISGQLFLRRNDGVVVYGAGSTVTLVPSTSYSRERASKIYGEGKIAYHVTKFENDSAEYRQYTKSTKADGQGKFTFTNLAPGDYFVTGAVTWCAPSQYGCIQQGGALLERTTIAGNSHVEIVMDGR